MMLTVSTPVGRPRKMRTISHLREDNIQRVVWSHLVHRARKGVIYWHTPNGGKRNQSEAAKFRRLGVVPGIPDLLLLADGRLYCLEIKTVIGHLSPDQKAMHAAMREAGATVATAFGLDEALKRLETWGIFDK